MFIEFFLPLKCSTCNLNINCMITLRTLMIAVPHESYIYMYKKHTAWKIEKKSSTLVVPLVIVKKVKDRIADNGRSCSEL